MAGRAVYDDWNFMGESLDAGVNPQRPFNSRRNSSLFLFCFLTLVTVGFVILYSASYPLAVSEGRPHYYYLVRQAFYIAAGIAAGGILLSVSDRVFRSLVPVLMFAALIFLGFFDLTGRTAGEAPMGFVFAAAVMYLSLYFSNRKNSITRGRELVYPLFFGLGFLVLTVLQGNFVNSLLFGLLLLLMFAAGGTGFRGTLLLFLFLAVPAVCAFLADMSRLTAFLAFLVPGLGTEREALQSALRLNCIVSGGWQGRGLGAGVFKNGVIDGISGPFILCSLCEETGFLGLFLVMLLFFLLAVSAYRCSRSLRVSNPFYSNLCTGLSAMLVWQFLLNAAGALGLVPVTGLSMPFFSAGWEVTAAITEAMLIYRCTKAAPAAPAEETVNGELEAFQYTYAEKDG